MTEADLQRDAGRLMVRAIDPGPVMSAVLLYNGEAVLSPSAADNDALLRELRASNGSLPLVIEAIQGYGQRASFEEFETARMIGRFQEAYERNGGEVHLLPRRAVKMHLVGAMRAKDADIRAALLHRFGDGTRASACGSKAKPGPLHGVGSHLWSALAVAVTWYDLNASQDRGE